jgi:uncharacterized integral membrane protein
MIYTIMCIFKEYSEVFGKVGGGLHKYKILNVIIVDNLATILLAIIVTYFIEIPFPLVIMACYLLGILLHYLFGVQTQTLTYLGLRC